MKKLIQKSGILFFLFLITGCSNNSVEDEVTTIIQREVINGDTVNRIDSKNRKQGLWYLMKNEHDVRTTYDTVIYKDGVILK